ncbi:MAG: hypothetical protein HYS88_00785 [Candidatus Colwellbacteria bacterium]|nr:hypothetical protein [Candidatus Colwellbacteria bacterium]
MALGASDLKKGSFIIVDGAPYVVVSLVHSHIGRGGAVFQTKIKNLKTSVILERNFKPGDSLGEAEITKMQAVFIYERRGEYWFHQLSNPANRFFINADALEGKSILLKPKMEVVALKHIKGEKEEIINIELPIKADYKVIEAPPNIKGSTADGGRKTVTLEGGLKVNAPLFIQEGDTIRINTETGEYAERV